jgi:hypothetical protein
MIMWLDNRNIATVFFYLDVTIFCCKVFYSCLHHSTLADKIFYKQNDIEPVPFGCQLQSLPRLRAELDYSLSFHIYSYYSVYLLNNVTVFVCHYNFAISMHYLIAFRSAPLHSTRVKQYCRPP